MTAADVSPAAARADRTGYRPDIDGLRAIAVLAVLLFHFDVPPFGGGFVGVDVFFVISGYLITGITLGDLGAGRFSVLSFYARRVRRIVPALLVVSLAGGGVSLFVFLPTDLRFVGSGLTAAVTFTSNILFYSVANDYFAADNLNLQPMLHTWSLSVEAQFYLIYPWLLIALRRRGWPVAPALLALATLSLAASTWAALRAPSAAFYLLPTRAWELLLGGLLVRPIPVGHRGRGLMAPAGLLMIGAAALLYGRTTPFPGAAALLPCLGAALVILGGAEPTATGRLLKAPPLVFIGRISYSLYLWHWPLLVFASYGRAISPGLGERLGLILLSGVLATLSWRYVERLVLERRFWPGRTRLFVGAAVATAAMALVGIGVDHVGRGEIPLALLPADVVTLANGQFDWTGGECLPEDVSAARRPPCRFGDPARDPTVVLWGNSYARMWTPTLDLDGRRHDASGVSLLRSKCLPLDAHSLTEPSDCTAFNQAALSYIEAHPGLGTVVLGANWFAAGAGLQQLGDTIHRLTGLGRKVVVLLAPPQATYSVPRTLAMAALRHQPPPEPIVEADARAAQQASTDIIDALRQADGFKVIDPATVLCDGTHCAVERDGHALYYDAGHVTLYAAERAQGLFDSVFQP